MTEVNEADTEQHRTQDQLLDGEWVRLLLEARRLGYSPNEIRTFFTTAPSAPPDLD
ncbi:DNA-binding anti-repressor SinI [Alicyclobacillaceae bacterium I2511]|jgi:hypothetical protein|nr:DNA-binding anti-repressor SinI [Alicyclobacillaceae bacterium I2511]